MQTAVSLADIVYHVVAAVALIVGGGWAYFKFIKGRTFQRRLQVVLEGNIEKSPGVMYLIVNSRAQNIGLRELNINAEESALSIFTLSARTDAVEEAARSGWELLGVWSVFEDQLLLEPDESIRDPQLLELPEGGFAALRLELVVSPEGSERSWQTSEVVVIESAGDNAQRELAERR